MLASITLLPALLGFAGRTIDRFSVRRRKEPKPIEQTMWYRWSRVVQRRPWPAAIGGLAILLVLAIPLLSMRLAFPDAGGNPKADTSRQAYDLVAEGFGAGLQRPAHPGGRVPQGRRHRRARPARDASAADARRRRGGRPDREPVG